VSSAATFSAVSTSGGLLPGDLLTRLLDGDKELPGTSADTYGLFAGESIRRKATVAYTYLRDLWHELADQRTRTPEANWTRLTRERWLLPLLRELGYTELSPTPAGGITVEGTSFPVSHLWRHVPVHMLGWGTDLDRRTARRAGAANAAPQSMLQQVLNRSDAHLWAILSNGQQLRLLRDSTTLVGSAYLEFDLESVFDGEQFSDFVLLFLTAHATRLSLRDPETGPASCWLERWREEADKLGERALHQLREGVKKALGKIGSGLLDHPDNGALRTALATGELGTSDLNRALLRLVYRLLFWFVAEDRDLLLDPQASDTAKQRYATYFSSARLRRLAIGRRHSRHHDLLEQVRLIFDALGTEGGASPLALPGIGGIFEDGPLDEPLHGTRLTNTALLEAVEALAVIRSSETGRRRSVDFRHLDAEELGSVYEGLLELHPRVDPATREFSFDVAAGHDRKETGSYYTPSSLVERLLDTALEPLLDEACAQSTRERRVAALLDLTVCDPACGSGHFLIAAARRIAKRLAAEETDEVEPTETALRSAVRRVIGRNIYGVDLNEMAVELTKVALWLEAMQPGQPLSYVDSHIRVGNSLLGTTPKLLADGIPDNAFKPIEGDDGIVATALRRQNTSERRAKRGAFEQIGLFDNAASHDNRPYAAQAADLALAQPATLADLHVHARRVRDLEESMRHAKHVADAWCAGFVQPKTHQTRLFPLTQATFDRIAAGEASLDLAPIEEMVDAVARQYRFFHWHLEFPHIFRVPDDGLGVDETTGWTGGFGLVVGNPPWERVKLQEKEFFDSRAPEIANAPNAAARKQEIAALADSTDLADRELFAEWTAALRASDGTSVFIRESGRYPLTATGDINTYAIFAEAARTIMHPTGRLGIIVPTGIATDQTTARFFRDLIEHKSLVALYDFENEDKVFPSVHNQYRFALLTLSSRPVDEASVVFRVRQSAQIVRRAYTITPEEILQLNPNTATLPVCNSRRDADIALGIFREVPVLWRDAPEKNPWSLSFVRMFDMAIDSGQFKTAKKLEPGGWSLSGNVYQHGDERMLPLYEAKLVHHFDHRFATYEGATQKQLNKGTLPRISDSAHQDPAHVPMPRYWVDGALVEKKLAGGGGGHLVHPAGVRRALRGRESVAPSWNHDWLLGWRDVCRSVDERTVIAGVIPRMAVGHKFLLAFVRTQPALLLANLSALVLDYVARQKHTSASFAYYLMKQLPVLTPDTYSGTASWDHEAIDLGAWITDRVLELTYTSYDIAGFARELADHGPPFSWNNVRRELIRAELDAAYFHLYGIASDDVDYILTAFTVLREREEKTYGEFRTRRLVLECYDAMSEAIRTGKPYQTVLDPPPGHGPRHPSGSVEGA